MVQIALMFIVLTLEFGTLGNLSPLPTATKQISELLTECVMKGEVNMDLQNKLLEGTCQLDGFCVTSPNYANLYSVHEF